MNGQQCPKLLWYSSRNQLPELSFYDQHKFAQGRELEKYVKKLFPDGTDLGNLEHCENIKETQNLISQSKTIFEASMVYKNLFFKGDILECSSDGWNLYEIKASTEVKKEHIPDLAFQKFVCEKSGINIKKCFIKYINKEYIKQNSIDPIDLVLKEDVTEKVNQVKNVEENSEEYIRIIEQGNPPEILISKNCNNPYECPLKKACWGNLPEYHVLQLTDWRKYWELFEDGILDIKDIPKNVELSPKDQLIKKAVDENKILITKDKISDFLKDLQYPLYYFDFETFDTAIPIFTKSKPYQKIPFQYSLHIQDENNKVNHLDFLAQGEKDPRPSLLRKLKNEIGKTGDIIVYHKSFEIGILKDLARDFPENKDWIENMIDRIVDLEEPFKKLYYYHPKQKGKTSLKVVLPTITGKDYSDLEISDGTDASMQFFYSHIKPELSNLEKIRGNLLNYCGLDTEGMIWIIEELKNG
jgi:CRISPR/Cas system-associated exonuclease Cas4 (RecB family)